MAVRTTTQFKALYGSSGTLFPDNTTAEISEGDVRAFGEDIADSFMNESDDPYTSPFPQVTASGTDTYTATLSPAITAYATGQKFQILFTNANTGAATLNLNGLGAKAITKNGATALASGDISAGQILVLGYDGTNLQIIGGGSASAPTADASTPGITKLYTTPDGTNTDGAVSQAGLNTKFRSTRTVTGTDACVQGDDNSLIIFNSATPFNFTLDQLTTNSKFTFYNKGAGAVTFVNGSGVTTDGPLVLDGAVGNLIPTGTIVFESATTPRVIAGTSDSIDLTTVSTAGGTITLDYALKQQRVFEGSASFATPKTIAEDNETNARAGEAGFDITNVAGVLTFPSDFTMPVSDARWDDGAKTFTPDATGFHVFTWVKYSTRTALLVPNVFP
jgi:hypothetical protein